MSPAVIWLAAGLGLMVAEAVLPGAFLVWLGIAALGTGGLVHWLALGFEAQVGAFAGLAAVAIAVGLAARGRRRPAEVNMPGSGLVGRSAVALGFVGAEGRVRLGDSDWAARLAGGGAVVPGASLRVVGVDGTVLLVQAAAA